MSEHIPILVENAVQIAWDYLEKSGQIDDSEITSWLLLDTIEHRVRRGERRTLALSNGAITLTNALERRVCRPSPPGVRRSVHLKI
jgi:hypothetical protein